jgi:hypothetical protein
VEHLGHLLWELITFSTILFAGVGLLVLRRRASGKPAFTERDRRLFFGRPEIKLSKPRFYLNFGIAVFLCYSAGRLSRISAACAFQSWHFSDRTAAYVSEPSEKIALSRHRVVP